MGIDIGGSGIKGALVDVDAGKFVDHRIRIKTPRPATPQACSDVIATIIDSFSDFDSFPRHDAPIGVAIPAPVVHGLAPFMANLDQSWVGIHAEDFLSGQLGHKVTLINDADAAGVAEMTYGAGRDVTGTVIVTTLGTGVGSALFIDGKLVPNTELGHLEMNGKDAEKRVASSYKADAKLSYKKWVPYLQNYYSMIEKLFWPDLIIVGGGISKDHEKFLPLLNLKTPIAPAHLRNKAGIVGAAWNAAQKAA